MRTLLYFIFFITISTTLFSQSSPKITISTDKINENGVTKYVHTVKKGETLYSLSKAYNVPQQVIIENNLAMKSGLQTGMMIFIPVKPTINTEKETTKKVVAKEVVAKTLSTKDNTKEETAVKSAVKETTATVKEATATKADTKNKKISSKKYKKHTAKWYENIDDIAIKYKVPVEAIFALNNLTTRKLSKRQQLLIPDKDYVDNFLANGADMGVEAETENNSLVNNNSNIAENITNESEQEAAKQEQETIDSNIESNEQGNLYPNYIENHYLRERYDIDRELNISLFLPINGNDTLATNKNFMEFYAGTLLAIENLKARGTNINLILNDTKLGSAADIIKYEQLPATDLIIGPIISSHLSEVLNITESLSIPVISPMDMRVESLLTSNNNLIQAPSLADAQMNNIVNKLQKDISKNYVGSNVVLCYEQWGRDTAMVRVAKELLESHNINYKSVSYTILEGRSITKEIRAALSDTLTNYVLVPSNNEGFVNDAVRNLNLVYNSYEKNATEDNPLRFSLNLYGMSKWRAFSTIEPNIFHKMGLQLSLPYYVDYSNGETKEFLLKYRALYNAEPSPYAYQGYDTAKYFISLVQRFGKEFLQASELPAESMLQSSYNLKRDSNEGGFGNNATRIIKYNSDYTIVLE